MWQGQTWATRKETLLLLVWPVGHMNPHVQNWFTKTSQVPWTGNEPICQVITFQFSAYILSWNHQKCNYSSWDSICPDVPKKVKWLWRSTLNIFWSTYILCTSSPRFSYGGLSLPPNFRKTGHDRVSRFRGMLLEKREWLLEQKEGGIAVVT